jgi:excisionase family DNA binding protein
MDPLRTMGEVADILRISRSTAFRMKKAQQWPHVRLGTEIRFTNADIEAIIQMNHQTPPPPKTVPNVGTRANRRRK